MSNIKFGLDGLDGNTGAKCLSDWGQHCEIAD